jgi:hypothetical protein
MVMSQHRIAWNTGIGDIILNYNGEGNETVSVSSDPNNLYYERQQIAYIKTHSMIAGTDTDVDVFVDMQVEISNPEYKAVITDANGKILWGRYVDNTETDIDLTGYTISGIAVSDIIDAIVDKFLKKSLLVTQLPKQPNFKTADGLFIITADNHYFNAKE